MKTNFKAMALLCLLGASACKKSEIVQQQPETPQLGAGNVQLRLSGIVTTTYYVDDVNGNDSNNGTSTATAWKTLTKVNATTFTAGNQILFKAGGTWTGQLHPLGSGTSGSPIVIGRYGTGSRPVINGAGLVNAGAVYLSNQEYWEVTNLEITNFNSTEEGVSLATWEANNTSNYANATLPAQYNNTNKLRYGVYIFSVNKGAVHHIYLHNLNVHGVNGGINQNDSTKANGGIYFRSSGSTTATWYDDILVDSCTIHDVDRIGMFFNSSWGTRTLTTNTSWTPSVNVVIRANTFYNTGCNALIVRVADHPLIEHNLFDHCAIKGSGNASFSYNTDYATWQYNESRYTKANVGDADAGGFDSDFDAKNTIIQYNYSHDNDFGVLVTGGHDIDDFNDGTVFRYNIIERDGITTQSGTGGKWIFKISGKATNTQIYNNTFDIGSSQTGIRIVWHSVWGTYSAANSYYYNNIIANYGTSSSYALGASTGNVFNYNAFYNNAATSQPSQTNSITGNVKLTNPDVGDVNGYKLLTGSVALGTGTLITGNGGWDFYGNSVSATTAPNVGCYNGAGL
jgi:hypothetical protein